MMTRSERCSPLVISSRSSNPVAMPVIDASDSNSVLMRSIAPASTDLMSWKPPWFLAVWSAMPNTLVSASSRSSLLERPSESNALSAISVATLIS